MTYENILKILDKYNIKTLSELDYYLSVFNSTDECNNDPENDKKNCTNAQCYEDFFVPECRKIIEVYKKYFQKDISKKKDFTEYLRKYISKSKSSIDNYMSCKSCNQQILKGSKTSITISDYEFKKDFCNNLDIKFDYISLFETEYISIKQFLIKEHQVTDETFVPLYENEDKMTKDEEKRLFELTHTSKEKLQLNLATSNNLNGSDQYKLNLALYAFDRNLIDESQNILELIKFNPNDFIYKDILQLQAKILSSQQKDNEAINILEKLKKLSNNSIDTETENLLSASIKREAFKQYKLYSDENKLVKELSKAKNIYFSIYQLNNDYYPALNYIYLQFMLAYVENKDSHYFKKIENEAISIWEQINLDIKDWWSFISNIEFLLIIGNYEQALQKLKNHFDMIDKNTITEFNVKSTLRQLKLYTNFCKSKQLNNAIKIIEKLT